MGLEHTPSTRMVAPDGPMIVRHPIARNAAPPRPGLHSHNRTRRLNDKKPRPAKTLGWLQKFLLVAGLGAIVYYAYTLGYQQVYQAYENWAFDQQIAGRNVAFTDYVREQTPAGFLVGAKATAAAPSRNPIAPETGSMLGRVQISRLHLSAMVREGVDAKTLSLAVGHVPSTALPGQLGNFAIAAHRDTLFRVLKDIQKDDLVTFQSPKGTYTYQVKATKIVKPSDVSVLRSDGGGLIASTAHTPSPAKLLTMITCYPFYYVGNAPKRFIVEAQLISSDPDRSSNASETNQASVLVAVPSVRSKPAAGVREARLLRSSSHPKPQRVRRQNAAFAAPASTPINPPKRRGFWKRLFHPSKS